MSQEVDVIYNRYGAPVLRLLDSGRLVRFNGKGVGFADGINLYNDSGKHVGWFEKGIMRDHNGAVVGFGESPQDMPHPFLPFRQFKPFPAFVGVESLRPLKQLAPYKPIKKFNWSVIEPIELFV